MEQGKLYLCATPIGNLEDISYRTLKCLKSVDLIAAEDTRNSIKLLNHFEIKTPMTSYHEYNKYDKAVYLVNKMLNGENIAIITDAGTPCISDPGEELVKEAARSGIEITSLPGASAVVTALSVSGLSTRRFAFEAFLPSDKKERATILDSLKNETRTIILYEAPHRLLSTLNELFTSLGNRKISLCRELSKRHEEIIRTDLISAIALYEEKKPLGEFVLVIEGRTFKELKEESKEAWKSMPLKDHMSHYLSQGISEKEAMKKVAKDRGVSKRDIYKELKI